MILKNAQTHLGQGTETFSGDVMQRQIFNSNRGLTGSISSRFGAVLAMAGLLLLSACSSSQKDVNQTDQTEPRISRVAPRTRAE